MRKSTRKEDLGILEEGVSTAKTDEGRKHRKILLEQVYEQEKDGFLEQIRIALIDALKRNDVKRISELRKIVEDYARSRVFVEKMMMAKNRIR